MPWVPLHEVIRRPATGSLRRGRGAIPPVWPSLLSEEHRRRLLEQALEGAEEFGGQGTVDGAVVGGEGDGHQRADGQGVADDDRAFLGRGDGEDADFGQVEDRVELAYA